MPNAMERSSLSAKDSPFQHVPGTPYLISGNLFSSKSWTPRSKTPQFTIRGLIREQNVPRTPPSTAGTMPRRSGYNADDALRLTPLGTHPAAGHTGSFIRRAGAISNNPSLDVIRDSQPSQAENQGEHEQADADLQVVPDIPWCREGSKKQNARNSHRECNSKKDRRVCSATLGVTHQQFNKNSFDSSSSESSDEDFWG